MGSCPRTWPWMLATEPAPASPAEVDLPHFEDLGEDPALCGWPSSGRRLTRATLQGALLKELKTAYPSTSHKLSDSGQVTGVALGAVPGKQVPGYSLGCLCCSPAQLLFADLGFVEYSMVESCQEGSSESGFPPSTTQHPRPTS